MFVALADTISTASAFAARAGDRVHGNQEMIGIGTANVAAGFFQGFPVSTSGSRTAVAEQAGAKSQFAGLVGAAAIVLILVAVPGLLRNLPQPALAAVVIAASLSLADVAGVVRLWTLRRTEAWLAVAAFLAVTLLGVLPGIGIAVALSILNVFRRTWWPHQAILGDTPDLPGFHDLEMHPDGETTPGLVIFRFDAPLIFANARTFREQVHELAEEPDLRWILIAAEPITDVDTTAADMLVELDEWLNARGISLVFAEMKDPVHAKITRYELTRTIDPSHFYPTIRAAVKAFAAQDPPDGKEVYEPGVTTTRGSPGRRHRGRRAGRCRPRARERILRNVGSVLIAVGGVSLVIVGGWYSLSKRGGTRLLALGAVVRGVALLVVA